MSYFFDVDLDTPRQVYNWRLWVASCSAGLGGALFGYDTAFLGGSLALPAFKTQFGLTNLSPKNAANLSSNIVITFQAGCILACVVAYPSAQFFGRRPTILVSGILCLVGAAIQMTGNLDAFYAGRFLTGLGVGPLSAVCPMYAAEIAPPRLRGTCVGMYEIMFQLAALVGFWINYGVSLHVPPTHKAQWLVPVSLQLPIVSLLIAGCILFMPETPRFLMKKGRSEDAARTLASLRQLDLGHDYIRSELIDTEAELRIERGASESLDGFSIHALKRQLKESFAKGMKRRMLAGVVVQFIGQMSGINGINYYAPTIYASFGIKNPNTVFLVIGFYGVARTIGSILFYTLLIDRIGRRNLLFLGSFLMTLSLCYTGGWLARIQSEPPTTQLSGGSVVGIAFVYLYAISFIGTWSGIAYILPSECVPLNLRALGNTFSTVTLWTFNLAITKATPYMIDSMRFGTFFFFAGWAAVGSVYVYFFIPETKHVPLEHMARVFGQEDLVEVEKRRIKLDNGEQVAPDAIHLEDA